MIYWWLKNFLSPSPLHPLGNWAFLYEYLIGTLNSTVQNWTHFLPTPGTYRICTQIPWLGIPPWPLLFVFSSILTSYRSWTHMPFYILSPSQNSCCWAQTPISPPSYKHTPCHLFLCASFRPCASFNCCSHHTVLYTLPGSFELELLEKGFCGLFPFYSQLVL